MLQKPVASWDSMVGLAVWGLGALCLLSFLFCRRFHGTNEVKLKGKCSSLFSSICDIHLPLLHVSFIDFMHLRFSVCFCFFFNFL